MKAIPFMLVSLFTACTLAAATIDSPIATNNVVVPRGSAAQILVPAAGSLQGGNGTFFKSDISIVNYRTDADQRVRLQWIPRDATGGTSNGFPPVDITIRAAAGTASEDFVATVLQRQGLGAILVTAITDAGAFDTAGRLYVTDRIWTQQPGSAGTVSQSFPTISTADFSNGSVTILGQRNDPRYRSNVGIVNLETTTQSYTITYSNSDGTAPLSTTTTVPPFGMTQLSLAQANSTGSALQISVNDTTGGHNWIAYGSSVDNITGDSWSSLGFRSPLDAP
jgi:hypothetical protein